LTAALTETIGAGRRGRADPRVRLARSLAAAYGARVINLCGSGTDALRRAIRFAADRAGGGAKVALPAYTCFDVATAAVGARVPVVLYDLDPATLGPDLDSLRVAFAEGARVVVVAPLYGMPVDWAAIEGVAGAVGAVLIEDAAQGQGASWRGRPLGSLGPIGVLSFGRGKGWTGGRGGALLLRSGGWGDEVAADPGGVSEPGAPAELPVLALAAVQWVLGRPAIYGVPASLPWLGLGETRYRDPAPEGGMALSAAVLLEVTRGAAAAAAGSRREVARELLGRIPVGGGVVPIEPVPDADPGYLRLALRLPGPGSAFARTGAARRLGIGSAYPSTLAALPALRERLSGGPRRWPGAEILVRELVTLPTHTLVSRADRERIGALLASVVVGGS
jgi:dTDP-4-amino-4,6-dideoxygalactose transaminase